MDSIVKYARTLADAKLYGDLDYFIQKTTERCRALRLLADKIEEQEKEIVHLKGQVQQFINKIMDKV